MAYIGKIPATGAFQKCDAISVVNGQAAYTLQVGSTNVSPESVNHMIVSLNGVIQVPTTAYTIAGAVLTFDSNLATGDVIDFVLLLGNVLDVGTVSDDTIATAKIQNDAVTLAKMAAGTDGNIISYDASGNPVAIATGSDGQVLTSAGAGQPPAFEAAAGGAHTLLLTTNASDSASVAFSSTYITSTYRDYMVVISGMLPATDNQKLKLYISSDNGSAYKSGSGYDYAARGFDSAGGTSHTAEQNGTTGFQLNSTNASNEADSSLSMVMNIFHPLSTTFAFSYYGNGQVQDTADDSHLFHCAGYYDADHTTAFNNFKFQMASGNITSGQFRLYGIT